MARPKHAFASLVCASVACVTLAACADSRPTRSECIIGFRLDWSGVKADRHVIRNSLRLTPEAIYRLYGGQPGPVIAKSFGGTRLYFQFARDCDKKQALAAEVIAFWRSKGLDLPRFERIEATIVPSPNTIEVSGPPWKDGPEDIWLKGRGWPGQARP